MLLYQSESILKDKIERICDNFQCKRFPLPQDGNAGPEEFGTTLFQLKTQIMKV